MSDAFEENFSSKAFLFCELLKVDLELLKFSG